MATSAPITTAFIRLARLLLGGVFLYAGGLKSLDPAAFATDIDHFHLLPHGLSQVAGVYLPWLEMLCGGAVILGWRRRGALIILTGLCVLFGIALASAWIRGLDVNCGCFGHDLSPTALPLALVRSLGLGLVAIWLLRIEITAKT